VILEKKGNLELMVLMVSKDLQDHKEMLVLREILVLKV